MSDARSRPLTLADASRRFGPLPARSDRLLATEQRLYVAGGASPPRVEARVLPVEPVLPGQVPGYEIVLTIDGVRVDQRASPRPLTGKGFTERDLAPLAGQATELLAGFHPDHLPRSAVPQERLRPRPTILPPARDVRRPTTVFAPDNRQVFRDTAYPWSTVGLVETPRGSASGVMIGPRHILTVSHVIDWDVPAPFAADWVKFTPSYFDGGEPFGHAWATNTYWILKEDGDGTISGEEAKGDFVVVVLDSRIGELTGWMGARGYADAWDGLAAWSHMGYPGDLNSGQRPCFQGGFAMDGSDTTPDAGQEILHKADVFPGQSGGPLFGWWDGDVGPRAVAVQSWQRSDTNGASGGGNLDGLVIRARTDFP